VELKNVLSQIVPKTTTSVAKSSSSSSSLSSTPTSSKQFVVVNDDDSEQFDTENKEEKEDLSTSHKEVFVVLFPFSRDGEALFCLSVYSLSLCNLNFLCAFFFCNRGLEVNKTNYVLR
jgi:hypothetical protein